MTHLEFNCSDEKAVALIRASRLYDEGVMPAEWISVKERMPNADGEYLVFQHGYSGYKFVRTASFNVCYSGTDDDMHGKTVWYDYDSECGDYELIDITHWMPLPEAPKEE